MNHLIVMQLGKSLFLQYYMVVTDCHLFVHLTDWGAAEEDAEDINVWEDNWDDDNIEDDFSEQLR